MQYKAGAQKKQRKEVWAMDNNVKDLTQSKEIAEHVCRSLVSAVHLPKFGIGSVPVSVVAKVMGKDLKPLAFYLVCL